MKPLIKPRVLEVEDGVSLEPTSGDFPPLNLKPLTGKVGDLSVELVPCLIGITVTSSGWVLPRKPQLPEAEGDLTLEPTSRVFFLLIFEPLTGKMGDLSAESVPFLAVITVAFSGSVLSRKPQLPEVEGDLMLEPTSGVLSLLNFELLTGKLGGFSAESVPFLTGITVAFSG